MNHHDAGQSVVVLPKLDRAPSPPDILEGAELLVTTVEDYHTHTSDLNNLRPHLLEPLSCRTPEYKEAHDIPIKRTNSLNQLDDKVTAHPSRHALERLGVDENSIKKDKGLLRLGISTDQIEQQELLRKASGIPPSFQLESKLELILGFRYEQVQRVKAVKTMGTTEEEILEDYSRRVSMLGVDPAISKPQS